MDLPSIMCKMGKNHCGNLSENAIEKEFEAAFQPKMGLDHFFVIFWIARYKTL